MSSISTFNYGGAVALANGVFMYSGVGDPTGVVTAPIGSIYLRSDGSSGTSLYVKENTGSTGWTALGKVGQRIGLIPYTIDGGGLAITTGIKGQINVPFACTITGWVMTADQTGSAVVDVLHSTYGAFPTTTSIAGTDKPTISSAQKNENLTISAWTTTTLSAGDQIQFNVNSSSTVTRLNVNLIVSIAGTGGSGGGGGGGSADSIQSISTSTTISFDGTLSTVIQATAGSGGITLTLPSAAGVAGQTIVIMMVDVGPGVITVNTASGEFIRASLSTISVTNQWQTIGLKSNGVGWIITSAVN